MHTSLLLSQDAGGEPRDVEVPGAPCGGGAADPGAVEVVHGQQRRGPSQCDWRQGGLRIPQVRPLIGNMDLCFQCLNCHAIAYTH